MGRVSESGRRGQGSEVCIRPLSVKDVVVNCECRPSASKSLTKQSTQKGYRKVLCMVYPDEHLIFRLIISYVNTSSFIWHGQDLGGWGMFVFLFIPLNRIVV